MKQTQFFFPLLAVLSLVLILQPLSIEATNDCDSSLELFNDCYDQDDPNFIKTYTSNCSPQKKDWVGLYKDTGEEEEGKNEGAEYWKDKNYDWQYVCSGNKKKCSSGRRFKFNYFRNWQEKLDSGEYKIYLFSNDGYYVKAESEAITVNKEGSCEAITSPPIPTPPPTPTPCEDRDVRFQLKYKSRWKKCKWVGKKKTARRCNMRIKKPYWKKVEDCKLIRVIVTPVAVFSPRMNHHCYPESFFGLRLLRN